MIKKVYSVSEALTRFAEMTFLERQPDMGRRGGSNDVSSAVWEKLWKLDCPNKVKHFLWRLTHNSHPLRCNLARRGMKIDTIFPICRKDEDGGHLFFKCKYAKTVWRDICLEHERGHLSPFAFPMGCDFDYTTAEGQQTGESGDSDVVSLV